MDNILIVTGRDELKQIIKEILSDSYQTQMKNPVIKTDSLEKPLTRNELKEKLGCSLTTIWKYTKNKTIPFFRMGRKMYFNLNDVMQALKDQEKISFNRRGGSREKSEWKDVSQAYLEADISALLVMGFSGILGTLLAIK